MSEPARHLHVVDAETGFVHALDEHPEVQLLRDQLAGAEKEIQAWRTRYAVLKRESDAEARGHDLWPQALELFGIWRVKCKGPKSRCAFTPDRFWLVQPYLARHGREICELAIEGAAFDPFCTTRKNGTTNRHNGWPLIFQSQDKFESFVNRAPREARDRLLKKEGRRDECRAGEEPTARERDPAGPCRAQAQLGRDGL